MASDSKALYLADHKNHIIYKLDSSNGKVLAEIPALDSSRMVWLTIKISFGFSTPRKTLSLN
jgi:hypothetical protein